MATHRLLTASPFTFFILYLIFFIHTTKALPQSHQGTSCSIPSPNQLILTLSRFSPPSRQSPLRFLLHPRLFHQSRHRHHRPLNPPQHPHPCNNRLPLPADFSLLQRFLQTRFLRPVHPPYPRFHRCWYTCAAERRPPEHRDIQSGNRMPAGRPLPGPESKRRGPPAANPENSVPGLFRYQTGGFSDLDGWDTHHCLVSAVLHFPSAARRGTDLLSC